MSGSTHHPIPEFRDVSDHFWGPGQVVNGSHEIIRPKPRRPGDVNRLSADANVLLKNSGYSSGAFAQHQQPPAFAQQPQHQQQLHQQQQQQQMQKQHQVQQQQHQLQSTPVLKSLTPRDNNAQVFRNGGRDGTPMNGVGGVGGVGGTMMVGRSGSRERLVQNQILCLPSGSTSRELMGRDSRDAWDYYGAPVGSSPSSPSTPLSHNGVAYGRPTPLRSGVATQPPVMNVRDQRRDPRFVFSSPVGNNNSSNNNKMETASSPQQRLFNQTQGLAFKSPPCKEGQLQQQQRQSPQQQQPSPQQQQQQIHQVQYPYYNAKLESLTHRMPNLSFEGLSHQPPQQQQHQTVNMLAGRVEGPAGRNTPQHHPQQQQKTGVMSGRIVVDSPSEKQQQPLTMLAIPACERLVQQPQQPQQQQPQQPQQQQHSAACTVTGRVEAAAEVLLQQHQQQPTKPSSPPTITPGPPPSPSSGALDQCGGTSAAPVDSPVTPVICDKFSSPLRRLSSSSIQHDTPAGSAAQPDTSAKEDVHEKPEAEPEVPGEEETEEQTEETEKKGDTSTQITLNVDVVNEITPESTDCGSLSKSSSDGDPVGVVSRKRPPTKLKSRRRNILSFPHHISVDELRLIQRRKESYGGSSSDENRSSGHASMSDGHTSSSPPAETLPRHTHYRTCLNVVPEDDKMSGNCTSPQQSHPPKTQNNRRIVASKTSRHRLAGIKDDLSSQLEHATGLEDIKMAIEQLTLRSHGSRTSYSTSTYSSLSGSEGGEPMRRLIRHSSLDTINTNVTVADEFVWVDSYNRLVELQQLPWSNHDVLRVIQNGRIKEHLERVSMETVPRLSYLLQRALVRIARETQRLARPLAMCSKQEVCSALRIVLSPALADSCIKACLRGAAMFTVSGDMVRQSKSARAALQLSVGRFHRWMCDVRLGKFIHDYAAVYLAAGLENLLEEVMMQCMPQDQETLLTASVLENAIAGNADLWGLLQPYAHLNAGRTATGALALPRWPSQAGGVDSGLRGSGGSLSSTPCGSTGSTGSGGTDGGPSVAKTLEQSLLTTCVGTINELSEMLQRVTQFHFRHSASCPGSTPSSGKHHALTWASSAVHALFYFMRCSQLEHAEHARERAPIQELVYERPYMVLPPLIEWVRVASAHAEHRHSQVLDKDDVGQAARLLLPGVDSPIRSYGFEEILCPRRHMDDVESSRKLKIDLAFKMLSSARSDLIPHALQLLPSTKINTVSEHGLTPLMLAAIRGDEALAKVLLDAGADVDAETPTIAGAQIHPGAYPNPETQHWTALTYAAIQGQLNIAKLLLERGANVEGGARLSEDKCTETPLQVAAGTGILDMVSLLLSHGARPFLSTLVRDTLCYSSSAQKGCYSAIAVSAAHGQRAVMHKLLSHPVNGNANAEVLSLEEILAEGASQLTSDRKPPARSQQGMTLAATGGNDPVVSGRSGSSEKLQVVKLNKGQIKALQEAMYHSAENAHLDITLDLRNLGVPWTLHCWMHTLATAHEHSLENIIDQLLQDFLQVWGPDDYSTQFVDECLPIIFNIFRYSKNEGTTLLLADIFATCYGREPIKDIRDTSLCGGPRIDPKFVNNPELSDVQFRVEGRVFYAHKLILITASARFKSMLNSKFCEGNPPIIQINDIRYDIFQMVMHYLYKGGCENLDVNQNDVLELMAAANFFQLDGLLRFCESRCSTLVDLDNIVSMYIHAKVYNALQLLEYCQGFLLQNMVALLTYDDSVRRLIFGKKLHNHDVLAGLLLTLQARIKSRSQNKNK